MTLELERVTLPAWICDYMIRLVEQSGKQMSHPEVKTEFSYFRVKNESDLFAELVWWLPKYKVMGARVHKFAPLDFITRHVDTMWPGCDTIIVRLDSPRRGEKRLFIGDGENCESIEERATAGIVLPEGTHHEVVPGMYQRYSLVVWGKRNDPPPQNPDADWCWDLLTGLRGY